jgi:hypothetical protein
MQDPSPHFSHTLARAKLLLCTKPGSPSLDAGPLTLSFPGVNIGDVRELVASFCCNSIDSVRRLELSTDECQK